MVAVGFSQHVVVRLALPIGRGKVWTELFAQKLDRDALIGISIGQAEPDEMRVIGHQDVDRAREFVASAGVKKRQLPGVVKRGC